LFLAFLVQVGGLIVVPALIYLCKIDSVKARCTAIFCIMPLVITSSIFYAKNSYIDFSNIVPIVAGGVIGGFIGAKLLNKLPKLFIQISFIVFVIFVAIRMICK